MQENLGKKKDSPNFKLGRGYPKTLKNFDYRFDFSQIQIQQPQQSKQDNELNYYFLNSFKQNKYKDTLQPQSQEVNNQNDSQDSCEKLSEAFNVNSSLTKQHNLSSQYSEEFPSQQDQSLLKALSFMDDSDEEKPSLNQSGINKLKKKLKKKNNKQRKKEESLFSTQDSKKQKSYQGNYISFQSKDRERLSSIKESEQEERDFQGPNSYKRRNKNKKTKKNKRNCCPVSEKEQQYDVDVNRIEEQKKTTFMIRNIPNKYSKQLLLEEINSKFAGKYDFFYLPMDFQNNCNLGYAFINFIGFDGIKEFYETFNNQKWTQFNSDKICQIKYARIQGREELEEHLEKSMLMKHSDQKYKPVIFKTKLSTIVKKQKNSHY